MKTPLTEGLDYYLDRDGFVVLTERHHLDRGYCCGLSCRHCPYLYEAVPEPKRSLLLAQKNEERKEA
jgi:hypothetical protein